MTHGRVSRHLHQQAKPRELPRTAFERDAGLPALATDFTGDFFRLSDHRSNWDDGNPAIMLTDTAMCRNIHYHRPSDTPEKLYYPVMALLTLRIANSMEAIQKPPIRAT